MSPTPPFQLTLDEPAAEPVVKPKFLLSDNDVERVLSASRDSLVIKHEPTRLLLTLPSVDWLEFGLRLLREPLSDTVFIANQLADCRVAVTFFSRQHPRLGDRRWS